MRLVIAIFLFFSLVFHGLLLHVFTFYWNVCAWHTPKKGNLLTYLLTYLQTDTLM